MRGSWDTDVLAPIPHQTAVHKPTGRRVNISYMSMRDEILKCMLNEEGFVWVVLQLGIAE